MEILATRDTVPSKLLLIFQHQSYIKEHYFGKMAENNETFLLSDAKGPIDIDTEAEESQGRLQMEQGTGEPTTDSREDERLIQISREIRDDEEEPVFLMPRFGPSCDADDDMMSLQACTSSNSASDWHSRPSHQAQGYLRHSPPSLQMPGCDTSLRSPSNAMSLFRRDDKPTLCRSLAWSQDSMEERRQTKRSRKEDLTFTPTSVQEEHFSFSGYGQHKRQDSSPTMVHWEEKVVGSIDLVGVLERALTTRTSKDSQE